MYAIYADGVPLWSPLLHQQGYDISDPKMENELNNFGSLTFTMEPGHPMYDSLIRLKTVITVERDGKQVWRGRLLETETDFYNRKTCTCEGELAFLADYMQPPFEYSGTLLGYISRMLIEYNANVDSFKRFHVGNVTVVDSNDYVYRYKETYNTTWSIFNDQLIDSYGGYLIPRTEDGVHYLDYLSELPESGQIIRFGENLLDLDEVTDASDVFTVLIPLGAIPEDDDSSGTEGDRLTIESVNDGKIYIENQTAIDLYGRIWAKKQYDDITLAKNLLSSAKADLASGALASTTITVSAVDLSQAGVDTEDLEYGTLVHVISAPHGVDTWLELSKETRYLQEPDEDSYTLGKTLSTLTDSLLKTAKNANTTVLVNKTTATESEADSNDDNE